MKPKIKIFSLWVFFLSHIWSFYQSSTTLNCVKIGDKLDLNSQVENVVVQRDKVGVRETMMPPSTVTYCDLEMKVSVLKFSHPLKKSE